jgi:hypothetical protein
VGVVELHVVEAQALPLALSYARLIETNPAAGIELCKAAPAVC